MPDPGDGALVVRFPAARRGGGEHAGRVAAEAVEVGGRADGGGLDVGGGLLQGQGQVPQLVGEADEGPLVVGSVGSAGFDDAREQLHCGVGGQRVQREGLGQSAPAGGPPAGDDVPPRGHAQHRGQVTWGGGVVEYEEPVPVGL
ncbi:hypothetical protein LUX12_10405 [Streptomyces somaliensis]|nr:hypothetical protein [Streptomyces somaliensis]MCP9945101.1 hypothetical protein [Streptomyces somaliensis]